VFIFNRSSVITISMNIPLGDKLKTNFNAHDKKAAEKALLEIYEHQLKKK